jgi:uncharacterized protein
MLLDTSGLLCLHHRGQPFFEIGQQFYRAARVRLTHSYILAEFSTLAVSRGVPRSAAIQFIIDLLSDPQIEVVWVAESLHLSALNLLQSRQDKTYSLCDAASFVLMRERNIHDALSTDRHFEQEGFRRLLS